MFVKIEIGKILKNIAYIAVKFYKELIILYWQEIITWMDNFVEIIIDFFNIYILRNKCMP